MDNWKELSKNQLSSTLKELEESIFHNESNKTEVEKLLHDPELFKDQNEAVQKTKDFDELTLKLKLMYERWDEVTEYLDFD